MPEHIREKEQTIFNALNLIRPVVNQIQLISVNNVLDDRDQGVEPELQGGIDNRTYAETDTLGVVEFVVLWGVGLLLNFSPD